MRAKPTRRRTSAQQGDHRVRNILIGLAAVVGVIALGLLLYLSLQEPDALDGLRRIAGLSRGHTEDVTYDTEEGLPPVGGLHSATWQNCGIYTEPVEAKHVMHSLEHGAVWLTYQPELSGDTVEQLQTLVRDEAYVIMSPYPGLRSPVILTAWGIQLEIDDPGDGRIANFIGRYQQGPQTPELGASCTDGTGSPINR